MDEAHALRTRHGDDGASGRALAPERSLPSCRQVPHSLALGSPLRSIEVACSHKQVAFAPSPGSGACVNGVCSTLDCTGWAPSVTIFGPDYRHEITYYGAGLTFIRAQNKEKTP